MKCILILVWFLSHGYSHPESIGIVSNLYTESRCDPNSQNKYQIGIAQWQGNRQTNLKKLADDLDIPWSNLFLQLYFLDQEWKQIKSTTSNLFSERSEGPYPTPTSRVILSASHYAIIFCQKFERPKSSCLHRGKVANLRPWEKKP